MATGALAAIELHTNTGANTQAGWVRINVHVPCSSAVKAGARLHAMIASAKTLSALGTVRLHESDVRDEAWASAWKQYYHPFKAAPRLYVAPTWERGFRAPRGNETLWIDPGMAFGTGQHQTTQLALELLRSYARKRAIVLDIGCGSGILALAAAQRGASVYASDMDSIAVQATRANFAANNLHAVAIRRARGVPAAFPTAGIITANITARVLEHLSRSLARKLRAGGVLITSGVTERGRAAVLAAFKKAGLKDVEERQRGDWYAHVHRKQD